MPGQKEIDGVQQVWALMERGGLSFFLFLIALFSAYIFYKVILTTADELKKQNDDIKAKVDNVIALNEKNADIIKEHFTLLKNSCESRIEDLKKSLDAETEFNTKQFAYMENMISKELGLIKENQGRVMAGIDTLNTAMEMLKRVVDLELSAWEKEIKNKKV